MRGDELLEKMELVDPAYVEAADAQRPKRRVRWTKWGAAACAAALVVAIVAVAVLPRNEEHSSLSSDAAQQQAQEGSSLPILTISEGSKQGMGFEGYMAYDVSEIISANPWTEDSQISELPVYKNPLEYENGRFGMLCGGIDFEKMREQLLNVAGRVGLNTEQLEITDDVDRQLVVKDKGMQLSITPDMTTEINFYRAATLPEKYSFNKQATEDELLEAADYLQETYSALIDFESPQVELVGGDYFYDGRRSFRYVSFFDASGSAEEAIIHYNFDRVNFMLYDCGYLMSVYVSATDRSQKVGDYPLITAEEAKEKLAAGYYKSTVPAEFPGLDYVARTELVYRTGNREEYFMPYYKFLVEIPEMAQDNGLKNYGAFYVPAVEEAYLSDQIVWDGRFN